MRWAFVLLMAASQASAQAPQGGALLSWVRGEGADECIDQQMLARAVAERLGYDPFGEPYARALEGTIARIDGAWEARLYNRSDEGAGSRTLRSEAEDCREIDNAVVLSLALAIDPEAALRAEANGGATPEAVADADAEAEDAEADADADAEADADADADVEAEAGADTDVDADPDADSEGDGVVVLLGAMVSRGLVPGWGAGVRLGAEGPFHPLVRWRVGMRFWPEQRAARDGAEFGIGITGLLVGACVGRHWQWVGVHGCADVEVGVVHSVVFSPEPNGPGDELWGAAYGSVRLTLRAGEVFRVGLHAGVGMPFRRLGYRVEGRPDTVFRASVAAPVLGMDVGANFP